MNKVLNKVTDRVLGINFTLGFAMFVWLIGGLFLKFPEFNQKNVFFVVISCVIPWVINFVFGYSSKLYMKGLLHGILWFVIEIIAFNLTYGVALDAFILLRSAVIYALFYTAILFGFYKASSKLNIPVRHVAEFFGKLVTTFNR